MHLAEHTGQLSIFLEVVTWFSECTMCNGVIVPQYTVISAKNVCPSHNFLRSTVGRASGRWGPPSQMDELLGGNITTDWRSHALQLLR